jgi:hypothetical protein
MVKITKRIMLALLIPWLIPVVTTFAGPPFRTDDPIPIEYLHGEIYLFSTGTHEAGGTNGVGPAVEFNYGILPDTQFHIVAPMAYNAPEGESSHFGYGDTELGVKYRFVHQTSTLPDIGVFPLVELPTGDRGNGLGNGEAQYFLPVWLQKDFGKWTTYGGGGYWINPGSGNKNYWFTGILLQYSFFENFYLGGEIFYKSADTVDGEESSGFNLGGSIPLVANFQVLFSAGSGLTNSSSNEFSYYIALYRSF